MSYENGGTVRRRPGRVPRRQRASDPPSMENEGAVRTMASGSSAEDGNVALNIIDEAPPPPTPLPAPPPSASKLKDPNLLSWRLGWRGLAAAVILLQVLLLAGFVVTAKSWKKRSRDNVRIPEPERKLAVARDNARPAAMEYEYPHDHPDHPWHWTRERPPDPSVSLKRDCDGNLYADLYRRFHERGYVIFRSCSLQRNDDAVLAPVGEFTASAAVGRVLNKVRDRRVRALSVDPDTIELLEYLHGGRRTFPKQTINFPRGTQQPVHSDLIHFDTMPRTLMAAVWTALEDIHPDSGPLKYYPGSHHLGTNDFDEIGLRQMRGPANIPKNDTRYFGKFYSRVLEDYLTRAGLTPEVAELKRGQMLVWAAGLCHGGSKQNDKARTRLSQVTHYYFEGSQYYWVPRLSDRTLGKIEYTNLEIRSCRTSAFAPEGIYSCADGHIKRWLDEVNH